MGKLIMTVDDSYSVRQMISFTLKQAGYDVVEAQDGSEAIEKLKTFPISMLITDLNMPNMKGIDLIKKVRGNPQFKYIPIIILTTDSDNANKQAGIDAGATGRIVKPFNRSQLLAVVAKLLG